MHRCTEAQTSLACKVLTCQSQPARTVTKLFATGLASPSVLLHPWDWLSGLSTCPSQSQKPAMVSCNMPACLSACLSACLPTCIQSLPVEIHDAIKPFAKVRLWLLMANLRFRLHIIRICCTAHQCSSVLMSHLVSHASNNSLGVHCDCRPGSTSCCSGCSGQIWRHSNCHHCSHGHHVSPQCGSLICAQQLISLCQSMSHHFCKCKQSWFQLVPAALRLVVSLRAA